MTKDLTVRDLVLARLEALKFATQHEDLASYYGSRDQALAAAFGVTWSAQDRAGYFMVARSCELSLADLRSPFSGYLEVTSEIADLFRTHGGPIDDAVATARGLMLDLLLDVTCRRFGLAADHTVPVGALADLGFDVTVPAPDPLDYW